MPTFSERSGVPRTLGVEHPFGQTLGPAGDRDRQRDVLGHALDVLERAEEPGYIEHSDWRWPDLRQARRSWSPPEPSPIEAAMQGGEFTEVEPWELGAEYVRPTLDPSLRDA